MAVNLRYKIVNLQPDYVAEEGDTTPAAIFGVEDNEGNVLAMGVTHHVAATIVKLLNDETALSYDEGFRKFAKELMGMFRFCFQNNLSNYALLFDIYARVKEESGE